MDNDARRTERRRFLSAADPPVTPGHASGTGHA